MQAGRFRRHDWPSILRVIQTFLNEPPLTRLGMRGDSTYRCPLEVMAGLKSRRIYTIGIKRAVENTTRKSIERITVEQVTTITELQSALLQMHTKVHGLESKNRAHQIRAHNKKTNTVEANFTVGDYILV